MKRLITICAVTVLFTAGYASADWTTLDYPGAISTQIGGISGSSVIGMHYDNSGNGHGFLYDGTSWTTLDYPGAEWTEGRGISGGSIVGG